MSQGPRRHLRLENVDGVTVVSFVESKIVTEENIQSRARGTLLMSLAIECSVTPRNKLPE